jgi:hypothetical protein
MQQGGQINQIQQGGQVQQTPQQQNDSVLVKLIQNYVHYDNLTNNYNKQVVCARKLKNEFEHKVIQYLRGNRIENATIQVSGACLQLSEEKTAPCMSASNLKKWLKDYYAQKGNSIDESDAILRYINLQKTKETQINSCLKKIQLPTVLPPPPSGTRI